MRKRPSERKSERESISKTLTSEIQPKQTRIHHQLLGNPFHIIRIHMFHIYTSISSLNHRKSPFQSAHMFPFTCIQSLKHSDEMSTVFHKLQPREKTSKQSEGGGNASRIVVYFFFFFSFEHFFFLLFFLFSLQQWQFNMQENEKQANRTESSLHFHDFLRYSSSTRHTSKFVRRRYSQNPISSLEISPWHLSLSTRHTTHDTRTHERKMNKKHNENRRWRIPTNSIP